MVSAGPALVSWSASRSARSRRAVRAASSYLIGSNGTMWRMRSSLTTTSLVIESTRLRPVVVSTSVTSDSQREDSWGESRGTGTIGRSRPWIVATRCSIVL